MGAVSVFYLLIFSLKRDFKSGTSDELLTVLCFCRASGIDATWVPPWLSPPEVDVVGTSSATNPASHSRAQAVARRLASVSETYAHDAVEDTTPWNFWSSQQWETITASIRVNPRNNAGLRFRNNSAVASNMPDINIMVERVREILPHIPDELIIQVQEVEHTDER